MLNKTASSTFPDDQFLDHDLADVTAELFGAIKSSEWEKEREWRLISFDNTGAGYFYMGDYEFDGVVLGLNCADQVSSAVGLAMRENHRKLVAKKSQTEFGIELE